MEMTTPVDPTIYYGPGTLRPHCTSCGHYLLPCTATATGIHPVVVGVSWGQPLPTA